MYGDEIEADKMISFRTRFKQAAEERGVKLTFVRSWCMGHNCAQVHAPHAESCLAGSYGLPACKFFDRCRFDRGIPAKVRRCVIVSRSPFIRVTTWVLLLLPQQVGLHPNILSHSSLSHTGLVVPNIKDCQEKSMWEIASEMDQLISKAR